MRRVAAALAALSTALLAAHSFAADDPQEPALIPVDSAAVAPQEPQRPGLLKRKLRSFLSDDAGDGLGLHLGPFVPQIEIVSSGAGLAPLLHFWAPDIGGTALDVHASASYSVHRYQYYDLQLGLVNHEGKRLPRVERGTRALFPLSDLEKTAAVPGFNIYFSARYRDYPREVFYGVGAAAKRLDRTDYRLQDGLYEGIVRTRVGQLSLMGRAGLLQTSILATTDPDFPDTRISNDEGTAPGLLRSPDFLHLSAGAWLELRDQPDNPHRGVALGVAYSRFDDRHGSVFQFNRATVVALEYIPLGSNRHVVALRQATLLDRPDAGSSVPFYLQATLGGSSFLRGFSSFRFRDDKLLALGGEYRFELRPKLELAFIYETGKVFGEMSEFDLGNLRRSYGVGIRLKSQREVRLRLDVMHSSESTRMALKLGPSF